MLNGYRKVHFTVHFSHNISMLMGPLEESTSVPVDYLCHLLLWPAQQSCHHFQDLTVEEKE